MKSHLTSSTTSQQGDRATTDLGLPNGSSAAVAAHAGPHLTLVHTRLWSHRLILKGSLDQGSAPELQDEIECLHQEGVTTLTLDLRQLDVIDPSGAQLIVAQSALFRMRGRQFAVVVGSPVIRRTLTEAGGTDLLAPAPVEVIARRGASGPPQRPAHDLSTRITWELGLD